MRHRLAIPCCHAGTGQRYMHDNWWHEQWEADLWIYDGWFWNIFHFIAIHPSSHVLPCLLASLYFPGISIFKQLNDFLLFIIFGLSHYSIISIYLDGHPNYISIVVVRANGRQMEFPVITANLRAWGTRPAFVVCCLVVSSRGCHELVWWEDPTN